MNSSLLSGIISKDILHRNLVIIPGSRMLNIRYSLKAFRCLKFLNLDSVGCWPANLSFQFFYRWSAKLSSTKFPQTCSHRFSYFGCKKCTYFLFFQFIVITKLRKANQNNFWTNKNQELYGNAVILPYVYRKLHLLFTPLHFA